MFFLLYFVFPSHLSFFSLFTTPPVIFVSSYYFYPQSSPALFLSLCFQFFVAFITRGYCFISCSTSVMRTLQYLFLFSYALVSIISSLESLYLNLVSTLSSFQSFSPCTDSQHSSSFFPLRSYYFFLSVPFFPRHSSYYSFFQFLFLFASELSFQSLLVSLLSASCHS